MVPYKKKGKKDWLSRKCCDTFRNKRKQSKATFIKKIEGLYWSVLTLIGGFKVDLFWSAIDKYYMGYRSTMVIFEMKSWEFQDFTYHHCQSAVLVVFIQSQIEIDRY